MGPVSDTAPWLVVGLGTSGGGSNDAGHLLADARLVCLKARRARAHRILLNNAEKIALRP